VTLKSWTVKFFHTITGNDVLLNEWKSRVSPCQGFRRRRESSFIRNDRSWSASSAHLSNERDEVSTDNSRSLTRSRIQPIDQTEGNVVPDCTECLETRFDLSPLFLKLPRIGRVGGERASELITRSVSLPSSQRDITRTWKGAVRNGPARRAVGYFYLNGDAREKDSALVLLCERSVWYVSWWRLWTGGHRSTPVNWDPY